MLGKVMASIAAFVARGNSVYPVKGAMIRFQGAGGANPTTITSYNCTVVRNAAGVYRVTVTNSSMLSLALQTDGIKSVHSLIAPTANTAFFDVQVTVVSATQFDIKTYEITQGAGTTLARAAYDIIAGDFIDFSILLNAGSGIVAEG
jgi:hypothetical protein